MFMIDNFGFLLILFHLQVLFALSNDLSNQQSSENNNKKTKVFSGLYDPPKVGSEFYAGAWLTTKKRLLNSAENIGKIINLEGASFHLVLTGPVMMTRDFFDFEVIHLSSTSNNFPDFGNVDLQKELLFRMTKTVEALKVSDGETSHRKIRDKRALQQTVVIIAYSNDPASQHYNEDRMKAFTRQLRSLYFQATVWSIYRIFPKIVVTCGFKEQLDDLKKLPLPIWKYVDLSANLKSRYFLPRDSLLYIIDKLRSNYSETSTLDDDRDWEQIKYIYYSEADQILHARHLPNLFLTLDRYESNVALVPHRMQSIALAKTFEHIDLDKKWIGHWPSKKIADLKAVEVIIEDAVTPQGSCCDDGRFKFADCGAWWYNCPSFGLQNYSQWVRFGEHGFTLPFATEHQAKCKYSKTKIMCPIPDGCTRRVPKVLSETCEEMPNIVPVK